MSKLLKCKNNSCNIFFAPKHRRHVYCCRECFMVGYKEKKIEEEKDFPIFKCPSCGRIKKLPFSPKLNYKKWTEFRCKCGFKPMEI